MTTNKNFFLVSSIQPWEVDPVKFIDVIFHGPDQELLLPQEIVDRIRKQNDHANVVILTGNPSVYPELDEVINEIHYAGYHVHLVIDCGVYRSYYNLADYLIIGVNSDLTDFKYLSECLKNNANKSSLILDINNQEDIDFSAEISIIWPEVVKYVYVEDEELKLHVKHNPIVKHLPVLSPESK